MNWEEFNKTKGKTTSPSSTWDDFNSQMSKKAYAQEAQSQTGIDPKLFTQLKERGVQPPEELKPEVDVKGALIGEAKELGKDIIKAPLELGKKMLDMTIKPAVEMADSMIRAIRATTQVAATPLAVGMAEIPGGVSPKEAMASSLEMAKQVMFDKNVSPSVGIEQGAKQFLNKFGEKDERGGYKATPSSIAGLTALAFFDLFGDPAFELGGGLKMAKTAEKILTEEKVIKELPLNNDVKVKVIPEEGKVVVEGYKKANPVQQILPEGKLADDTHDIIMDVRQATDHEVEAKIVGDDLEIKPVEPIKKETVQQAETPQTIEPLIQEAKKYKSAEEFIKAIKNRGDFESPAIRQISGLTEESPMVSKDFYNYAKEYQKSGGQDLKLTDIWNKAQEKILKTPEPIKTEPIKTGGEIKTSKLALGVEQKAIEEKLVKNLGGLPEYETVNMADQAKKSAELLSNDPELALKVAQGIENAPQGILPESVFTAVEEQALKNGDVETITKLAKSNLVSEATVMGQRIRALAERNPNSPTEAIKDVIKSREKKLGKDVKKAKTEEATKIKEKIKAPDKNDWGAFIKGLTC